ncbi:MAG: PTS sugar transporter subunit IIA [Kiritimatiellae bacterium]|nr:PTS sugar transporter subunit IIA [Kiritimatiellia bacterium]
MQPHEIMTLEEVAKYLRVSERTVYDWAQRGEIPGGKIGTSWRFKRSDIQGWVDVRIRGTRTSEPSPQAVALSSVLTTERIIIGDFTAKKEALNALVNLLAETPQIRRREDLAEAIKKRESLMSTGIGMGVAVPHVRLPSVTEITMAALLSRQDIVDYESLDSKPVRAIFMIIAGVEQHTAYLKVLSAIGAQIKNIELRQALFQSANAEEFCRTLIRGIR